ncbi:MAG: vWA domain-containing protein [Pseudomonadota bacterium]
MKNSLLYLVIGAGVLIYATSGSLERLTGQMGWFSTIEPVDPNWASISAWPAQDVAEVEATPDPNRRITAIVLDDSGSMGSQMEPAKSAVLQALGSMAAQDRVAVIALNKGVVLPFTPVEDAEAPLRNALQRVHSDGGTPLTGAVANAKQMLEGEAAAARSFGTYRMIVTTDGEADDGRALTNVIEEIAAVTPIQIATIGIGIHGGHVLRRDDLGSFVDVSNVEALASALQDAIAENTSFSAITEFAEDG